MIANRGQELLEETRAFNAQLERLLQSFRPDVSLPPSVYRRLRAEGKTAFPPSPHLPEGQDRVIPGRGGPIRLRVFMPDRPDGKPRGVYLHLHGGGWALNSEQDQDPRLLRLCREADMAVVSVGYRLAPEHPYPAAPDDCEDAARWLLSSAQAEFGTDRLFIGGESAGAHLSLVTLLRLRDRHGLSRAFAGANLVYGAFDLTMTPSQRLWGDRYLILSTPVIEWFLAHFLPHPQADPRTPDISPLYADLRGLPPALFTVGTLDPLLDDTLFCEARYRAAGNQSSLEVYADGVHGFTLFPLGIAEQSHRAQVAFLREAG